MKSDGKRLRACVACDGRLPAGSRIDRKYCGQACITRAYYQRHPEKKRVLASRTRQKAESETRTLRQSDDLTKKVARLEADNAALRRRLEKAQAQSASPRTSIPQSGSQPPAPAPTQSRTQADPDLARLRTQLRVAEARVRQAEKRRAEAGEGIDELETQLKAAPLPADRGESAGEQDQPRDTYLEQAPPRPQAASEAPRRPRNESPSPSFEEEQHRPQQSFPRSPPPLPPVQQSAPARVREPLPWERPAEQVGQAPVPKWLDWPQDIAENLGTFSDNTLAALPTELYNRGERNVAAEMRGCLKDPGKFEILKTLSSMIVILIICTDRSQRRTSSQKDDLVVVILDAAIPTLVKNNPALAQDIKDLVDEAKRLLERLTLELLSACAGKEVNFNKSSGRWQSS